MRKQYDIFLHMLTKHTNLNLPYSDYVKGREFPNQIAELLNTEVTIKYRNFYETDIDVAARSATLINNGEVISSRPKDDDQQLEDRELPEFEKRERPHYYEGQFIVVRADADLPFRFIGISPDYSKIVVGSTEKDENDQYLFLDTVLEYPIQMNEYIGLGCYDQYKSDVSEIKAVTLRVDKCEPCYTVLVEFLGSTNMIRFILGDEAQSLLYDYHDVDGSRDYDNRHAVEEENPVDVTGEYADADIKGYIFTDVNGGGSNNWIDLYDTDRIMTDEEVVEFRKSILEGRIIYANN